MCLLVFVVFGVFHGAVSQDDDGAEEELHVNEQEHQGSFIADAGQEQEPLGLGWLGALLSESPPEFGGWINACLGME